MRFMVVVLLALLACGGTTKRAKLWPDAPLELRDDADR
jgi:hypothetical protein